MARRSYDTDRLSAQTLKPLLGKEQFEPQFAHHIYSSVVKKKTIPDSDLEKLKDEIRKHTKVNYESLSSAKHMPSFAMAKQIPRDYHPRKNLQSLIKEARSRTPIGPTARLQMAMSMTKSLVPPYEASSLKLNFDAITGLNVGFAKEAEERVSVSSLSRPVSAASTRAASAMGNMERHNPSGMSTARSGPLSERTYRAGRADRDREARSASPPLVTLEDWDQPIIAADLRQGIASPTPNFKHMIGREETAAAKRTASALAGSLNDITYEPHDDVIRARSPGFNFGKTVSRPKSADLYAKAFGQQGTIDLTYRPKFDAVEKRVAGTPQFEKQLPRPPRPFSAPPPPVWNDIMYDSNIDPVRERHVAPPSFAKGPGRPESAKKKLLDKFYDVKGTGRPALDYRVPGVDIGKGSKRSLGSTGLNLDASLNIQPNYNAVRPHSPTSRFDHQIDRDQASRGQGAKPFDPDAGTIPLKLKYSLVDERIAPVSFEKQVSRQVAAKNSYELAAGKPPVPGNDPKDCSKSIRLSQKLAAMDLDNDHSDEEEHEHEHHHHHHQKDALELSLKAHHVEQAFQSRQANPYYFQKQLPREVPPITKTPAPASIYPKRRDAVSASRQQTGASGKQFFADKFDQRAASSLSSSSSMSRSRPVSAARSVSAKRATSATPHRH